MKEIPESVIEDVVEAMTEALEGLKDENYSGSYPDSRLFKRALLSQVAWSLSKLKEHL